MSIKNILTPFYHNNKNIIEIGIKTKKNFFTNKNLI